ncbi:MAG: SDR family NAD(P)-dependent oxidoreductase, partial [Sinobacteraceae bacterium]|nr:SDR family NAD(P)-dependent oxidoreductase [Nevskiaceae bacterium]
MSCHQAGSVLITGGAGFIGANLAHRLLRHGNHVRILDNLSRTGVRANLEWLQSEHKDGLEVQLADVRDEAAVRRAVEQVDCIYHLAAQVAVTSSLENPVADFEVNVRGTLNVLEAMRRLARAPALVLTSTN